MFFADRSRTPEIMDGENFTPAELRSNLADLERYNRLTGGIDGILSAFGALTRDLTAGDRVSILDVGAGSADAACSVAAWALRRGWRPRVVASDVNVRMLEIARSLHRSNGRVQLCAADGRALPHGDGEFDLAYCSLVLHHLDEGAIERVLAEMRRVTRLGFIASDLRRSALAFSSVWALTRLTSRNRLTRNDGPLSVRRALTPPEMRALAERAGLDGAPRGLGNTKPGGGGFALRRQGPARMILTYRHAAAGASS